MCFFDYTPPSGESIDTDRGPSDSLPMDQLTSLTQTPKCYHCSSVNETNLKRMFRKFPSHFIKYPFVLPI